MPWATRLRLHDRSLHLGEHTLRKRVLRRGRRRAGQEVRERGYSHSSGRRLLTQSAQRRTQPVEVGQRRVSRAGSSIEPQLCGVRLHVRQARHRTREVRRSPEHVSAGQGEAAVTRTELRLLEEMLLAEDSLSERVAALRVSDGVDQQVGERAPQASVVRHQGRPSQRPARRRGEGGPHRTQQKVEAHGEAAAQQQVGRLHVAHVLQLVVRHRVLREALHRELAHEGIRADGHARGDHAVSLSRAAPASA